MTNPFTPHRTHPLAASLGDSSAGMTEKLTAADAIGFVDWDVKADRLVWDRGAEERFGVPQGSMADFEGWAQFVDPEDAARIREHIAAIAAHAADRMVYRYRFYRPDGDVRLIEGVALCWYDENFTLERMLGVVLDITRVAAEQAALARSEAQLRSVINTAPDAVLMIDDRGLIRAANGAADRIFGGGSDDVMGARIERLVPAFAIARGSDPDRPYASADLDTMLGGALALTGLRTDGSAFPIEINVDAVLLDGESLYIGFVRDITDRVEAEQRIDAFRTQYLRTARLNAMGAVAAGLAHELNQPLAASANFLAAARLSASAGAQAAVIEPLLEQAGQQIALAGDIIRRLRGFLAPGAQDAEPLRLADLIDEARALAFVGDDRYRVRIQLAGGSRVPPIHADRVQLLQVFVNLLRNAYDEMAGLAKPAIRISTEPCGDKLRIVVEDEGAGFDAEILGRIDTMFVSTKPDTGLGVGLSICRHIIEQWGGELCIGNRPQGGGQVAFTVPAAIPASGGVAVDQKAGEGLVDRHQFDDVDVEMGR